MGPKQKAWAGEWENGKIIKGKWIFPNGVYFEGPFVNNFPKGEGIWHFTNGNTVKGSFGQELKDNPNPEENAEEGEDNSQITVINWTTDPQISDPTRELYKVEETLLPPEELEEKVEEKKEGENNEQNPEQPKENQEEVKVEN